jgi:GNAT superfamily N-acetyltransferase
MNIIKAKPVELIEAFYLLRTHQREINCRGWMHWDLQFDLLRKEIDNGTVFLYKIDYLSVGLIILDTIASEEYQKVLWSTHSKKPLFVRHLMEHPLWRKYGIASQLLMFAEEFAKAQGFTSLRLDVYGDNQEILTLFDHTNYQKTGQVQTPAQQIPFYCFEKNLG